MTRRLTESVRPDAQPQWIDDKTVLFTQVTDGSKRRLMTVTDAGAVSPWFEDAKDVMGAVVSPDRKWVAFSRGDQEILIRPIEGGAVRVWPRVHFLEPWRVSVCSRGRGQPGTCDSAGARARSPD